MAVVERRSNSHQTLVVNVEVFPSAPIVTESGSARCSSLLSAQLLRWLHSDYSIPLWRLLRNRTSKKCNNSSSLLWYIVERKVCHSVSTAVAGYLCSNVATLLRAGSHCGDGDYDRSIGHMGGFHHVVFHRAL